MIYALITEKTTTWPFSDVTKILIGRYDGDGQPFAPHLCIDEDGSIVPVPIKNEPIVLDRTDLKEVSTRYNPDAVTPNQPAPYVGMMHTWLNACLAFQKMMGLR